MLVFILILIDCTVLTKDNDIAVLGIALLSIALNFYKAIEGVTLLYKKHICISKGVKHEGRIVGKIGVSTIRNGYFYKLIVLYEKDKITTPLIQAKYVDNLKTKKCIVYVYDNKSYISGYTLCGKGDSPVKIRVVNTE